jgi:hypothetical protein
MKIRELLQTEIWSKETTRKIIRRIWKFLKPAGAVLGVLALLLGVLFAVEWYWLTGGERKAGKEALAKIEEVQTLLMGADDRSNQDVIWVTRFDTAERNARAAVDTAERNAWTIRDRQVAVELSGYLWEIDDFRKSDLILQHILSTNSADVSPERLANMKRFKQRENSSQLTVFGMWNSELHKKLN